MPKISSEYVCQSCGYTSPKWLGRCPACSQWDSLIEETVRSKSKYSKAKVSSQKALKLSEITNSSSILFSTGISELNRVLGGGFTPNSTVLISGDPGVGKSTLLLQTLSDLAANGQKALYITGEESLNQIKMRAGRITASPQDLYILSETNLESMENVLIEMKPSIVCLDSIQTASTSDIQSVAGSVNQIRECAARLIKIAKENDICIFFVGHVTKEGHIAGPMTLEHMVDTVIYFEGDTKSQYRILRAVKNRFGTTNEIGIFEMGSEGLKEVKNPSGIFLSNTCEKTPGSVAMANIEGTRPFLLEVQALCSNSNYSVPTRISTGIDRNRILLLIAILEKKLGLNLYNKDVYVNITGGVRINERAGDLPVASAIISSHKNSTMPKKSFIFGEIGLTGEIRGSKYAQKRILEGAKLGFERCILPQENLKNLKKKDYNLELVGIRFLDEIFSKVF